MCLGACLTTVPHFVDGDYTAVLRGGNDTCNKGETKGGQCDLNYVDRMQNYW